MRAPTRMQPPSASYGATGCSQRARSGHAGQWPRRAYARAHEILLGLRYGLSKKVKFIECESSMVKWW